MDMTPIEKLLQEPERLLVLAIFYVIVFIVSMMLVVFIAHGATKEIQRGVIAKTAAFNMMLWRMVVLQITGWKNLPFPWSLFFWLTVLCLMLYFGKAFWRVSVAPVMVPRIKRSPWIYGAFILLCIAILLTVFYLTNRA